MATPTRPKRPKVKKPPTLFQRTRTNFLTGLVIVAPVFVTIWVTWTAIRFIDARVVPLVPKTWNPETYIGVDIAGFGVIVFLVFTATVGALTRGIFGRQLIRWGESLFDRTPVVRSIYNGMKQIVETLLNNSNQSFKEACLVQYPREGIWAVAFVATDAKGEVAVKTPENDLVSVFLPTTPNPTSGFLLFVPRKDMIPLDMSVEEAAKLVISAGLVAPPTPQQRPPQTRPQTAPAAAPAAKPAMVPGQ